MSQPPRIVRRLLDGVQYAVALTLVISVPVGIVSFLVGGDLVLLKWVLFLVGIALLGVGSFKLRPPAAYREKTRLSIENSYSDDRFAGLVNDLPPAAWYVGREDHLSDGARMLLASLFAFATSFVLEAVFKVGVDPLLA